MPSSTRWVPHCAALGLVAACMQGCLLVGQHDVDGFVVSVCARVRLLSSKRPAGQGGLLAGRNAAVFLP